MNRIGIIGGLSFESTARYYERINRKVNQREGGLNSADLVVRSVNFEKYNQMMQRGDWTTIANNLEREAGKLIDDFGCDYFAIASNTMHKIFSMCDRSGSTVSPELAEKCIHIGDCVAEKCHEAGLTRVVLLGTKQTMTDSFMKKRLARNGLEVVENCLSNEQIDEIDSIIFNELCCGIVNSRSRRNLENICMQAICKGEAGIILGCTELEMALMGHFSSWLNASHGDSRIIDSTEAHIDKIVDLCLES